MVRALYMDDAYLKSWNAKVTRIKDGKYTFKMDDELEEPDVTMIIEDLDFGGRFLSGEEDGTAAYMSGDLQVEGDLQLTMSFGALAEYIGDYLAPIRPDKTIST